MLKAILILSGAAMLLLVFFKIVRRPVRLVFRLLLNTALGFLSLIALNRLTGRIGLSIGINWLNAGIVGILGLPGMALLLILKWLLTYIY